MTAALAAGVAALLVLGAVTPSPVLVGAVLVAQAATVLGWTRAVRRTAPVSGAVVASAAAIGADLAVLTADAASPLTPVVAVLGLAPVAALGQQLVRRDGRPDLLGSVSAVVAVAVLAAFGAAWLALAEVREGPALVAVAAMAGAAPAVAEDVAARLPVPGWMGWPAAVLTGAVAGLVVASVSGGLATVAGVGVGLGAAVPALLGMLTARRVQRPHPALTAGLPVVLVAPVAYLLARTLVG